MNMLKPMITSIASFAFLSACSMKTHSGAQMLSRMQQELSNKIVERFAQNELPDEKLSTILAAINKKNGTALSEDMFELSDNIELYSSFYKRYALKIDGISVDKSSIRLWLDKNTLKPIQVEARLQPIAKNALSTPQTESLSQAETLAIQEVFRQNPLTKIRRISSQNLWKFDQIIRRVTIFSSIGNFTFDFAANSSELLNTQLRPIEKSDSPTHEEFTAPVYSIWEFANTGDTPIQQIELQKRVEKPIRNILKKIPAANEELLEKAAHSSFDYSKLKNGKLSQTDLDNGFWNFSHFDSLFPLRYPASTSTNDNAFDSASGMHLFGENAIVFNHPNSKQLAANSILQAAPAFIPIWTSNGEIVKPQAPWWDKRSTSAADLNRPALDSTGDARTNDPAWLFQNGFDEVQVYYAIDTFMTSMRKIGFLDPEISTRPFTGILFDTDVESQDNAYYNADAIYFSTYTKGSVNFARDNTTIWHELGHGIMDRLMGPHLDAVEGYGLSEGMADYISEATITFVSGLEQFQNRNKLRIVNNMWLYNSNESHDDGESYGGVMYDLLRRVTQHFGVEEGLLRCNDLILEAMRLTRDHEELTPVEWFEHVKYADSIARPSAVPNRKPGELLSHINAALNGRNYGIGIPHARMLLKHKGNEIVEGSEGSRYKPTVVTSQDAANFELVARIEDGTNLQFQYPVTLEVSLTGGPLQGAIKWNDEAHGNRLFTVISSGGEVKIPISTTGTCDYANTSSGKCQDFVYVKAYNRGTYGGNPVAKKRFYVKIQ